MFSFSPPSRTLFSSRALLLLVSVLTSLTNLVSGCRHYRSVPPAYISVPPKTNKLLQFSYPKPLCAAATKLYSGCVLRAADTAQTSPASRQPRVIFKMQRCSAHLSVSWSRAKLLLSEHLCADRSLLCSNYIDCDASDSLFYGQTPPHITWELFWTMTMLINLKIWRLDDEQRSGNKKGIAVWVHNISRPILTLPQLTVS